MQVVNEMRNYFNKLVRDTKNPDIKYFSNIELGESFNNPHLHIQLFFNDEKQIVKMYEKVINKFGLREEFCKLNMSESDNAVFSYVVKDYSKDMNSEQVIELDDQKRMYRARLGKNLRFTSMSKGRHTKAVYRALFLKGIRREFVDGLIDDCVVDIRGDIICNRMILMVLMRVLITIYNESKIRANYSYSVNPVSIELSFVFMYWIFGFIDRQTLVQILVKNKLKRINFENI